MTLDFFWGLLTGAAIAFFLVWLWRRQGSSD
jgi:hypothetical protein